MALNLTEIDSQKSEHDSLGQISIQSFQVISDQLRVLRSPQGLVTSPFVPHGIPGTVWAPTGFIPAIFASFEG